MPIRIDVAAQHEKSMSSNLETSGEGLRELSCLPPVIVEKTLISAIGSTTKNKADITTSSAVWAWAIETKKITFAAKMLVPGRPIATSATTHAMEHSVGAEYAKPLRAEIDLVPNLLYRDSTK